MSNINIENLIITKLCLEEILQSKMELETENDLQDSVKCGLDLSIRNLNSVIEMIDDKLEDSEILDIVEERIKSDDGTRYTLEDVKEYIKNKQVNEV